MQWNLNLATHFSFERHREIDIGAIIVEASSRMQQALAAAFNSDDVNICVSFDPTIQPQNCFMSEAMRQRCESIEEGVMSSIRSSFDL